MSMLRPTSSSSVLALPVSPAHTSCPSTPTSRWEPFTLPASGSPMLHAEARAQHAAGVCASEAAALMTVCSATVKQHCPIMAS